MVPINTSSVPVTPLIFFINNTPLQVVQLAKLLGVTKDRKLMAGLHSLLIRSATYKLYLLWRLKTLGTLEHKLASVYTRFILSQLAYA